MQFKSKDKTEVLKELSEKLSADLSYSRDGILGSMCSLPADIASEVLVKYHEKNLGDPGLFPGSAALEQEVIGMLSSMLHAPGSCGTLLSGGTEANILALWAAKKRAGTGKRRVILSETAHFSFDKAASLMDLELVRIPAGKDHRIDTQAAAACVDSKTMAIVGIAGTTNIGAVDDIPSLAKIALSKNIFFHIDAAFGGFILPFLKEAGYSDFDFDFRVPGVSSISLDPHKMGRCIIPTGAIIFRDQKDIDSVTTPVNYLSGGSTVHKTLIGTRSGASAAAVWAIFRQLGREGFIEETRSRMEATDFFVSTLEKIPGISLAIKPVMNIVGIKSSRFAPKTLAEKLRQRGWAVSVFSEFLRIAVMPHISKETIGKFCAHLAEVTGEQS